MVSTPRTSTRKAAPATRPWAAPGYEGDCLIASPAFNALADFQAQKMEAEIDAAMQQQEPDAAFTSYFIRQHPELSGDFRRLQKAPFGAR